MYQTAPSQHHLQLAAPPPYPGIEESSSAATHQSLFEDSDNGSNWSDSESEKSTYRDDKTSTGARVNVITRRHRPLPRRNPAVSEPYAGQGDWDDSPYPRRPGGQLYSPTNLYPSTGEPYSQPQPPLGPHPQAQHRPTHSSTLPPGQKDMAHENPFAPRSVPWHGQYAAPYSSNPPAPLYEPHPAWYPGAEYGYAPPNAAHFSAVPPGPYPYPEPMTEYYRGHVPFQNPPNPPPASESAPLPRGRRRRPPAAEASPQEHDLDSLQQRIRAVEIDGQQAEGLRQAKRERAQVERQRREMDRLRQDINADIRDAVDDIRREIQMVQSESHSEPGRAPSRMDGGGGGGEHDVLMQEIAQLIEGKRRLQPQDHAPGAAFRRGSQAGPGSARGSRIDAELRSEVETIVYDILGGSDVAPRGHRRAPSRSFHGRRAASDDFHPRTATQADDPRSWAQEAYYRGVNPAAGNPASTHRQADEREWVGVPPKSRRPRSQREDTGGAGAPRSQGAGVHQQQPPPPQAGILKHHAGANAAYPRTMAYQDSMAAGPAAAHADAAAFFTEDESDDQEVFPKREASYPEFHAGHPDLRHQVQLPRAPKPPYLRQGEM
ncbi:hypothetical protein LY78DRAFT_709288 [Colletotrichum sublineola]|nr:hypothetical protein LY78DRAFT_709288 [Colletotrichum sublineola]